MSKQSGKRGPDPQYPEALRPKHGGAPILHVRLPAETWQWVAERGGATWIRTLLCHMQATSTSELAELGEQLERVVALSMREVAGRGTLTSHVADSVVALLASQTLPLQTPTGSAESAPLPVPAPPAPARPQTPPSSTPTRSPSRRPLSAKAAAEAAEHEGWWCRRKGSKTVHYYRLGKLLCDRLQHILDRPPGYRTPRGKKPDDFTPITPTLGDSRCKDCSERLVLLRQTGELPS